MFLADDLAVTPANRLASARSADASKARRATRSTGRELTGQLRDHLVNTQAAAIRLGPKPVEDLLG